VRRKRRRGFGQLTRERETKHDPDQGFRNNYSKFGKTNLSFCKLSLLGSSVQLGHIYPKFDRFAVCFYLILPDAAASCSLLS
jgi:hypothetical protein